ncbi:hypothetical protein KHA80_06655 [Anaerobacillus sp. HL2]|nr:hypothetical protein KHA80_06655 [Anaerobacillus sp. HL2]
MDVSRKVVVDKFWKYGVLDTNTNVQFGEGGAGTFSDGKLTTGIKNSRIQKILKNSVEAGAPSEISYLSKTPYWNGHFDNGCKEYPNENRTTRWKVRFETKMKELIIENGVVRGVLLESQQGKTEFNRKPMQWYSRSGIVHVILFLC